MRQLGAVADWKHSTLQLEPRRQAQESVQNVKRVRVDLAREWRRTAMEIDARTTQSFGTKNSQYQMDPLRRTVVLPWRLFLDKAKSDVEIKTQVSIVTLCFASVASRSSS